METLQSLSKEALNWLNQREPLRVRQQIVRSLLIEYLGLSSVDFILHANSPVETTLIAQLRSAIEEYNAGKPLQYILGKTYFYGLEIITDERALIPRPETEELVDWIVADWTNTEGKILDIGTGTGCIALALKANLIHCEVTAVDYSPDAIALAKENAAHNKLAINNVQADALNLKEILTDKWDVIVSNPPYIPLAEKSMMDNNVLDFEPHAALFVDDNDPLLFYREIALYAFENLTKKGALYYEIHEDFAEEMYALMKAIGFENIVLRKDLQGKNRMLKVIKN